MLESSATKRDAKAYLQTFGPATQIPNRSNAQNILVPSIRAVEDRPRFVQGVVKEQVEDLGEAPHVAVVKFREPQSWDDAILHGVVKTLTQLRGLGFLSIIVVDCDLEVTPGTNSSWREVVSHEVDRVAKTIRSFGTPAAKIVDTAIWKKATTSESSSSIASEDIFVGNQDVLTAPLQSGHLVIVPALAYSEESIGMEPADPNKVVYALTRFLSGLQFQGALPTALDASSEKPRPFRKVVVDRVIVIDPLGGIPSQKTGHGAQVFLNLADQFDAASKALGRAGQDPARDQSTEGSLARAPQDANQKHLNNLVLAKDTLRILPPTSSVVITSPMEAANMRQGAAEGTPSIFSGPVGTRRKQNPLIHNLLTDRPIYSSSLPIGRIKPTSNQEDASRLQMPTTTLAKRGLPVTIFPSIQTSSWAPLVPGASRLRLTDTCVNLPRLVHLINDSFTRKLDVEHYLQRVNDNLAGIIIAGEYEGGAILTWERPSGVDEETAYKTGRLVPYLDKFAVLSKSQGAGGVADIVFNAMVRDCFPRGVCWRSRKDNPVNKWYFERSRGTRKLEDSNWTMFWTTPDASLDEQKMMDYEDVCRNVVPSWADKVKAAD